MGTPVVLAAGHHVTRENWVGWRRSQVVILGPDKCEFVASLSERIAPPLKKKHNNVIRKEKYKQEF